MQDICFEDVDAETLAHENLIDEIDYFQSYGDACGFRTVWSMLEDGIKMDNNHPFKLPMTIRNRCEVWGYNTEVAVIGTRWADIWQACDAAIRNAKNNDGHSDHHIYIEDLEAIGNGVFDLVTGS